MQSLDENFSATSPGDGTIGLRMPGTADILLPNHNPRFTDTNRRKLRPLKAACKSVCRHLLVRLVPGGIYKIATGLLAMVHIHGELRLSKNIESQVFSPRCTRRRQRSHH
jgi:hypothetical protein